MVNLILSMIILSAGSLYAVESASAQTSQVQMDEFLKQLRDEILKQEQLAINLQRKASVNDPMTLDNTRVQYENAVAMLSVKKTLFNNFVGTPSIKSPLIQQKLLQIFQKVMITPGDLSELEALVRQERPKYVDEPAKAPAQPLTPGAQ